jgi:hypothetical protein
VGLADFAADPARHPLSTPSGKVEIVCERYQRETGFPAIPTWQAPPHDPRYPLRLHYPEIAASHPLTGQQPAGDPSAGRARAGNTPHGRRGARDRRRGSSAGV